MPAASDQQNRSHVGAELRDARLGAGMRHAVELAGHLGVSEQTVNRWERGERRPQRSLRPSLADALRMSVQELDEILGTHTVRPPRARSNQSSNVVNLRQSGSTTSDPPSAAVDPPTGSPDLRDQEMRALKEDFTKALINGLQSGEASDENWTQAARVTAELLGVPWPSPPVGSPSSGSARP
jgi:transcriptional regulator with XRE-family HTH domain